MRQSDRNIAYGFCHRPSSPHTNNETESRLSGKSNCYYHGTSKVPEFTSIVHRVEVHRRSNQEHLYQGDDKDDLQGNERFGDQQNAWSIEEEEQEGVSCSTGDPASRGTFPLGMALGGFTCAGIFVWL